MELCLGLQPVSRPMELILGFSPKGLKITKKGWLYKTYDKIVTTCFDSLAIRHSP